jgi:hypothetical protein
MTETLEKIKYPLQTKALRIWQKLLNKAILQIVSSREKHYMIKTLPIWIFC